MHWIVPRLDSRNQPPHVEEKKHVLKTVVGMKRKNDFGDRELFSQTRFFLCILQASTDLMHHIGMYVCTEIYFNIYIHTHTHTRPHTHIYIYTYSIIFIFESLRDENCPHPGNRRERKEAGLFGRPWP